MEISRVKTLLIIIVSLEKIENYFQKQKFTLNTVEAWSKFCRQQETDWNPSKPKQVRLTVSEEKSVNAKTF